MKKITIAIDGFSSTGKSTLAKQLADKLKYLYVDTGAMYRAVTLYAMQNNYVGEDFIYENKLVSNLKHIKLSFELDKNSSFAEMYLNDKNIEREIRTIEVSNLVSKVSAIPEVRKKLVKEQQLMRKNQGIVMDGRDIGTVVFPNAELKLFMTASADKRAERRYKELKNSGYNVTYKNVLDNIIERDYTDTNRKNSPLIKPYDAVEIDNSELDLEKQFKLILNLVEEKTGSQRMKNEE